MGNTISRISGFITILFGLGVIAFGLFAAYTKNEPGWGIGGFVAGALISGWGADLARGIIRVDSDEADE